MTDLSGTQLSSLLETLPGIAQVLRSPVADAFIGVIRAASGQAPFKMADAEEIMRYAVRRNLLSAAESERILAEAAAAVAAVAAPKAKTARPASRPKAKPSGKRPARAAKSARGVQPGAKKRVAARKPGRPARKK